MEDIDEGLHPAVDGQNLDEMRVRRSQQSAAVSQLVPKASCGHPPDWAMSGVSQVSKVGQDCRMWLGV